MRTKNLPNLLFVIVMVLSAAAAEPLLAQPKDSPARVAIITEADEFSAVADLLTVELSARPQLQLLERAQIAKLYLEQGLSAANRDYARLGQVLGADGLLLMGMVTEGTNKFVAVRFVAVQPGVIIGSVRAPWPVAEPAAWARWLANHFGPLLPKLQVPARDAIPISVVNLRAAVNAKASQAVEQQLTVLAIERLTRERELFVLERRQMELLSAEHELKGVSESAFWNGSYLLDGVIDRDGYSEVRLTIHARLTPPAGGAPIELIVDGPRSDLSGAVEKLTGKIMQALQRSSSPMAWEPKAEAQKYFDEAKWALKWRIRPQAKAASESAWALGKRDLDCALVRLQSYLPDVPPDPRGLETGTAYTAPQTLSITLQELEARRAFALVIDEQNAGATREIRYLLVNQLPDPIHLDRAIHLLSLYDDFTRTLSPDEPKVGSPWHQAGIEALTAASQVLQYFHLVVDLTQDTRDELAELRRLARRVAERITRPTTVRESYWVGDRVATHDELAHTMGEAAHLFRCKLEWGCFWQDKPDDCIAIYRELLSSPVFCYFHQGLWLREVARPRVTAWTQEDRQRAPVVWRNFMAELNRATNFLWRMEAKALEFTAAKNDAEMAAAYEGLFAILFANRDAVVTNNVELLYLHWGLDPLVYQSGIVTPAREKLKQTDYFRRLDEMNGEYWTQLQARREEREHAEQFERQINFLNANKTYEFQKFVEAFRFFEYSKVQARELAPLLAAYKSNLVAQAAGKTGLEQMQAVSAITQVGFTEAHVNRVLHPPSPAPVPTVASPATNRPKLETVGQRVAPVKSESSPAVAAKALSVGRYIHLPVERLETNQLAGKFLELSVVDHRFVAGKLWMDLRYLDPSAGHFDNGIRRSEAAAVWEPAGDQWEIIHYPEPEIPPNRWFTDYFEITADALYVSGWEGLRRYDLPTRRWETLAAPWQKPVRLFNVSQRLFAAGEDAIFEIRDRGRSVIILASCRRRPAVSALDSLESLGAPVIFPGPNDSIRALAAGKIFSWDGHDWSAAVGFSIQEAGVFADGTLLVNAANRQPTKLWLLPHSRTNLELCLREEWKDNSPLPAHFISPAVPQPVESSPRWQSAVNLSLTRAPSLLAQSKLYFFVELGGESNLKGKAVIAEQAGRHAELVCLDPNDSVPLIIPLRFDLERGPAPSTMLDRGRPSMFEPQIQTWMLMTPDALLIGKPAMPGIWVIPQRELDGAIAGQKASRVRASQQQTAAADQLTKTLLEKYDRNHDGKIVADEKLAALGDPVFLESEWPAIDANHNRLLDAPELGYFDVNQNSVLDPPELAGIETCLHLLTVKWMNEFDADGDGQLSTSEFFAAQPPENAWPSFHRGQDFARADLNRDGRLDLPELELFLLEFTQRGLRSGPSPGPPIRASSPAAFKVAVEAYWKSRSPTNRTSPVLLGRPSPGPTSR